MLRFDTSDPPGNERPAAEYIQQVLEAEGIPVEMYVLEEDRPNVVARLKGSGAKLPLLLMAHTDVVPPGEMSDWDTDPYTVVEKNGKLYGRGTEDNQQAIVSDPSANAAGFVLSDATEAVVGR